jgi:hypothetical protein
MSMNMLSAEVSCPWRPDLLLCFRALDIFHLLLRIIDSVQVSLPFLLSTLRDLIFFREEEGKVVQYVFRIVVLKSSSLLLFGLVWLS